MGNRPVVSTPASPWSGFILHHTIAHPAETISYSLATPAVGLILSDKPVAWTWKENGREYTTDLRRGTVSLLPAGQIPSHFWREPLECVDILFQREFLARVTEDRASGECPEFRFVPGDTDTQIEHLIGALYEESQAGYPNGALFGECVATALAVSLTSRFSTGKPDIRTCTKGLDGSALKRVLDFIDAHLGENLSLDRIARIARVSPYHFNRLFKISIGQSVHQFVKCERIKRAQWLLRTGTLSAKEIAFACGFASQSHFATAFQAGTGVTPRAFRLRQ